MRNFAASIFFLVFWMQSGTGWAQSSIAVLGIEAIDSPPSTINLLGDALTSQVKKTGSFAVKADKSIDEIKLIFGCVDEKPSCMARAGRSLHVDKILWGTLKKTSRGYNLTVKLLDVANSRIEKFTSETLEKGEFDHKSAHTTVKKLVRAIFGTATGIITIKCNVAEAEVIFRQERIGLTDQKAVVINDVKPGTYLIQIVKNGYQPWTRRVTVNGGLTTELDAELVPADQASQFSEMTQAQSFAQNQTTSRGLGWKIAFWSGTVATVGLAVAMGISGNSVYGIEDEKLAAIDTYRTSHIAACQNDECKTYYSKAFESNDICEELGVYTDATEVAGLCDRGKARATLTNGLLIGMIASALASGFFFYKAYLQSEKNEDLNREEMEALSGSGTMKINNRPFDWQITPQAGPQGAGLGFTLNF